MMETPVKKLTQAFRQSQKRLLLLDYDGTLVDFAPTPPEAQPTPQVLDLLDRLSRDSNNTVAIISGRDSRTLEAWLGHLPVILIAEHGYFIRQPDKAWREWTGYDDSWKKTVGPIMQASASVVPGSFIEEKATALVWHYRKAQEPAAGTVAARLTRKLRHCALQYGLVIVPGNKVVEARVGIVNKGKATTELIGHKKWDFIFAAGDDATDEDTFAAMPEGGYTIKVGPGESKAASRVDSPAAFRDLLESLASL